MAQAESKEEYKNAWNDHVNSFNPAYWEIADKNNKEEFAKMMIRMKEIIAESADDMEKRDQFNS